MPNDEVKVCRTCGELWTREPGYHAPYTCTPTPEHDFVPAPYCALHDIYACPYAHAEEAR